MGNIWNPAVLPLRAPDGPGAFDPITGWGGTPTTGPLNPYAFFLSGCESCMTPVPVQSTTWGRIRALYR
jgi:hypothetical protein